MEQRGLLRAEQPLPGTTIVVRGGPDTAEKPLLGISVFAVLEVTLEDLLARRFATFRTVYLPTARH